VTKQKLNLFQIAIGLPVQPRACAPQVMGSEVSNAGYSARVKDDFPNRPIALGWSKGAYNHPNLLLAAIPVRTDFRIEGSQSDRLPSLKRSQS
jgi:hypothetical protein